MVPGPTLVFVVVPSRVPLPVFVFLAVSANQQRKCVSFIRDNNIHASGKFQNYRVNGLRKNSIYHLLRFLDFINKWYKKRLLTQNYISNYSIHTKYAIKIKIKSEFTNHPFWGRFIYYISVGTLGYNLHH
jgi:hypothetical protein